MGVRTKKRSKEEIKKLNDDLKNSFRIIRLRMVNAYKNGYSVTMQQENITGEAGQAFTPETPDLFKVSFYTHK